jgi:2-polyprenyl-3-methyl-5-hydroxy-6-metoxy-1,4-benzoquinol methylase
MRLRYTPGQLGLHFIVPEAHGFKRLYLRCFGIPDIRTHLTVDYALRQCAGLSFSSLLDVGCGTGIVTCCLASHFPNCTVVGLDRDEPALGVARTLAQKNGFSKVSFRHSDIESGDLAGSYDLVTCFAVLQFIQNCQQLVRSIFQVLVPGGHFLVQLPTANVTGFLTRSGILRKRYPNFHEVRGPFTATEALQLVSENGFEIVRMTEALKGPSVLAKELFYLALSISRKVSYALCPILNWITAFDSWYSGPGNALFLLARKPRR